MSSPGVPRYAGYIFDLDGTLSREGRPLPGAADVLARLRSEGRPFVVMSNNPLVPAETHAARLAASGLDVGPGDVVTSVTALIDYLRTHPPQGALFVIGESPLLERLEAEGFPLSTDPAEVACVVAAFDRTFDYRKWTTAFHAVRAGATMIATNADATYPTADGEIPDCAGIIAALEASTGREVEVILGKPSAAFLAAALRHLGLREHEVLIVGDRLATDIAMGADHGVDTALVLSGVTHPADLDTHPVRPTYVVPGVHALVDAPDAAAATAHPSEERDGTAS